MGQNKSQPARLLERPERGPGPSGPLGPQPAQYTRSPRVWLTWRARGTTLEPIVRQDRDTGREARPDKTAPLIAAGVRRLRSSPAAKTDPSRSQLRPAPLTAGAGPLIWPERIRSDSARRAQPHPGLAAPPPPCPWTLEEIGAGPGPSVAGGGVWLRHRAETGRVWLRGNEASAFSGRSV